MMRAGCAVRSLWTARAAAAMVFVKDLAAALTIKGEEEAEVAEERVA